jgi:hypothetical protein
LTFPQCKAISMKSRAMRSFRWSWVGWGMVVHAHGLTGARGRATVSFSASAWARRERRSEWGRAAGWRRLNAPLARRRGLPSTYRRHAAQAAWNRSAMSSAPFQTEERFSPSPTDWIRPLLVPIVLNPFRFSSRCNLQKCRATWDLQSCQ